MRLKLLRLDCEIEISRKVPATLVIEDKTVFTRLIESLLSENGEYAKEPYLLFDDDGKRLSPKKRLLVLNSLPEVPLYNRVLMTKLFKRVSAMIEVDSSLYESLHALSASLNNGIEKAAGFLWGEYCISADWDLETYLKAFAFSPILGEDYTLLDNCKRLFDLIADVAPEMPVVMVNARTFFPNEELEELLSETVFSGIQLLLLESTRSSCTLKQEAVTCIDQHFFVT